LGFGGSAVFLQNGILKQLAANPNRFTERLYLPPSDYVQLVTLGYDHIFADYLWLRVIQAFGANYLYAGDLGRLASYFDVITDLDPQFIHPYSFGNMVLGEEAGDHKRGLALLDKGMRNNPGLYRLPFEAAFFSYWTMDDAELAKHYAALAVEAPDCPEFVRNWVGYFDLQMGRFIAAYHHYFASLAHHYNAGDDHMAHLSDRSLRRAMDRWIEGELRDKAIQFREEAGRNPTVGELEMRGDFLQSELPDGENLFNFYYAVRREKQPLPEDRAGLEALANRFLRTGWSKLPRDPASHNPEFNGYLVWPGQEPYTTRMTFKTPSVPMQVEKREKNALFAISELRGAEKINQMFGLAQLFIAEHKEAHGEVCPSGWEEVFPRLKELQEPWGGEWIWDAKNCLIRSSTHKNLSKSLEMFPPL
jgi:hypothetical protein